MWQFVKIIWFMTLGPDFIILIYCDENLGGYSLITLHVMGLNFRYNIGCNIVKKCVHGSMFTWKIFGKILYFISTECVFQGFRDQICQNICILEVWLLVPKSNKSMKSSRSMQFAYNVAFNIANIMQGQNFE